MLQATQGQLVSTNLFAYANNNPVMNSDPTGYFSFKVVIGAGIAGGLWNLGKYIFWHYRKFLLKAAFYAFAGGFLTGAILGALIQLPSAQAAGLLGAVVEVMGYIGECVSGRQLPSASTLLQKALVGYLLGIAANGVAYLAGKLRMKLPKTGTKVTVYLIAKEFIKGVVKGNLDSFFSLR